MVFGKNLRRIIFLGSLALASRAYADSVGVVNFKQVSNVETLDWVGNSIADTITTNLRMANVEGLGVIERSKLEDIVKEHNSSQSEVDDYFEALKTGNYIGADIIVFGNYQFINKILTINVKIVDINKMLIVDRTSVSGSLSELSELEDKITKILLSRFSGSKTNISDSEETSNSKAAKLYQDATKSGVPNSERESLLLKLLALDPDYKDGKLALAITYYNWGNECYNNKDYECAIKKFKSSINRFPSFYQPYYRLVKIYAEKENYNFMDRVWREGLENLTSGEVEDLSILAAKPYFDKGSELVRELSSILIDYGIHNEPLDERAYRNLVWIAERAVDMLNKAVEYHPNDGSTYYKLGFALKIYDAEGAIMAFEDCIRVSRDPDQIRRARDRINELRY